ncbi:hypothetical protein PIROE2DRAFT_2243 [Piromyces sp. E2]|nr:hypothetical protein PIROE2DRAFT_2243 [Piromyces sp. E2]|eukprot:OUM69812.1 hypothetical protein PIROE2DRAFT_2243 [Piromyces sp. E2]
MNNNNNNNSGERRVNNHPNFYGARKDLEGFLNRVEIVLKMNQQDFPMIVRKLDKALKWANGLRRENSRILNSVEDLIREFRIQFGD